MLMTNDLEGLYKEFLMKMILVTTESTLSNKVASSRCQTLNLDLKQRDIIDGKSE